MPRHSVINSSCLALFCSFASPHLSSQGTVNSMMMIFIVADHKTMSGIKFVGTISGNLIFQSRSTSSCQSLAWSKIPLLVLLIMFPIVVSPSYTNWIWIDFFFRVLTPFRCFSIASANSRSTLLCRHVYLSVIKQWHMMRGYAVGFLWFNTGGNLVFLSVSTYEGL